MPGRFLKVGLTPTLEYGRWSRPRYGKFLSVQRNHLPTGGQILVNGGWMRYLPALLRNRLKGRLGVQQALRNSGWLLFDRIFRSGVTFLIIVWLARYLGPSDFGTFNFVLALVAITNALASLGVEGIVVRELVHSPKDRNEILGTAFVIKVFGGAIAFVAAILAISWLRPDEAAMVWLVVIAATGSFFTTLDVIDYWFRSTVQSKYTAIARVISATFLALVRAGLILLGAPVVAFIIATVVETALASMLLVVMYKIRVGSILQWRVARIRAIALLQNSWPLFFSVVAVMIYMKIDQVMIGQILGEQKVGVYSAAVRLVEMWYVVPAVIASSIFPALYKLKTDNPERYLDRMQQFLDLMVIVPIVVGAIIAFLAEPLVTLIYGNEYRDATAVLHVYIWSSVFVFLMVATGSYLLAENKTLFMLFRYSTGMIINVLLNWLLLPVYGIVGSAYATLIAYLFAAYLSSAVHRDVRLLFFLESKSLYLPGNLRRLFGRKRREQGY